MCEGLSAMPLGYLYSLMFDNHSTAQISIMTINFITGFVAVLAYFTMTSIPETVELAKSLVFVFRLWPAYNIGEGLLAVTAVYFQNSLFGANISYLSWKCTGQVGQR